MKSEKYWMADPYLGPPKSPAEWKANPNYFHRTGNQSQRTVPEEGEEQRDPSGEAV